MITLALKFFEGVDKSWRSWRTFRKFIESLFLAFNFFRFLWNSWLKSRPANQLLFLFNPVQSHIFKNHISIPSSVVTQSQSFKNIRETAVLFLHLLMVAPTLLCFPTYDKLLHCFEDFVHPSHVLVEKMVVMNLEEPMIPFVFINIPVSSLHSLGGRFWISTFFLGFIFHIFRTSFRFWLGFWWLLSCVAGWVHLFLDIQEREDLLMWELARRIALLQKIEHGVCPKLEDVIAKVTLAHIID